MMPVRIKPAQMHKAEKQVNVFFEKTWLQTKEKKIWARIITAVVLLIAVFQELATDIHLTGNWKEITVYVIAGYFGMATYRKIFHLTSES